MPFAVKLTKFVNEGSTHTQENFYFKCSSHVEVELVKDISGNEYQQYIPPKVNDNNKSIIISKTLEEKMLTLVL